jgi:hypothetical protein
MKEKDLKMTDIWLEWLSRLILVVDARRVAIITDKVSDFSQFIKENALMTPYVKAD